MTEKYKRSYDTKIIRHGINCKKIKHGDKTKINSHSSEDDRLYCVDRNYYCGRCHSLVSGTGLVRCQSFAECAAKRRMCNHIEPHEHCEECNRYCSLNKKEIILLHNCVYVEEIGGCKNERKKKSSCI